MLRFFKTHYLKSRVINVSYTIDKTMTQMCRGTLKAPDYYFLYEDQMDYYQAQFLSHIVKTWTIDKSLFSKYELKKYESGLEKLEKYRELRDFIDNMEDFFFEMRRLYRTVMSETTTPNVWNRPEHTTHIFQDNVHTALTKYVKLVHDLEDHHEWQHKVKDEIGYCAHYLYMTLNSPKLDEVFAGFDKQYFFK